MPLPDKIKNAPALHMGLELYYHGFLDLNSCRSTGWSAGPIPWTAIGDYMDDLGLEDEDRQDFEYMIRAMDRAYLKHCESLEPKK
jgi:hypothetical protein